MARQHVEYDVVGTNKDSGGTDAAAIKPVLDGEPAQAAVLSRPSENLRTRTEFIRSELEALKYMSEADRAFLLTSTANVTWAGLPTGTFSIGTGTAPYQMTLKPFVAPDVSTASRLIIGAGTASQITIRTRQNATSGRPRAYSGANDITFDFTPLAGQPILITNDGTPANHFHVRWDDTPVTGSSCLDLTTALNANVAFSTTWNLEAVMEGQTGPHGGPVEVGFPVPPAADSAADVVISGPEQLMRYMAGAADAEKHIITDAQLTSFFNADGGRNVLIEGDVVCVRYDELVMVSTYGGRRQSMTEAPESAATLAGDNLFLLRRFPERLPGSLPIATVVNNQLVFVNGLVVLPGVTSAMTVGGWAALAFPNTFTSTNTFNDLVTIAAKAVLQPTYLPGGAAHLAEIDIPQYRSLGVPTDSTDVGLYIGNAGLATALKINSLNYGAGIDVEMGLGANTRGLHVHASGAGAFQTAYFESGATSFGAVQADNTGDGQAIVARRSAEVSAPTYATAYLEGKRSDPAILVVRPGTTVTTVGGVGIDVTASPGSTRGGNAIKAVAAPAGATPTSNSNGAAINAQSVATAPAIYVGAVQSVGLTPAILGEGSVDATGALMSLENTLAPTASGVHTLLRVRTNQKATETSVVGLDVYNDDAAHVGIKFSGVANSIPLSFLSHALPAVAPVGGLGVESYTSGVGSPVGRNRLRSYIGSTLGNGTWSGKRVLVPVGATWNTSSTLFYWVDAEGVLHMRGNLIPTSAQNLVYNTLYTVNAGALEQGLWPTATAASMATAAQASGVSIPVQVGIVAGSGDLYLFQKYDNPGPFVTTSVSCISLDYPLFS